MSTARDFWDPRPERIAIFRALQLGDMLCAVPAFRALRTFLPQARITLIGLPWARSFVERFHDYLDDFIPLPGYPGNPEQDGPIEGLLDCLIEAQSRRFDVALQMHGSGETSNRVVALLGAKRIAGFRPAGEGGRFFMPWPDTQPEIHRYLSLLAFLGVPPQGAHLEMPLTPEDWVGWHAIAARHGLRPGGFVVLHPGSQLHSRRWPAARFAAVGSSLARDGWQVVVTGTPGEAKLAQMVMAGLPRDAIDLTGETTLGSLAALIARAALVVCNDTGVSHVAAAMGARSVVVASGSDVRRWAPLDAERHPVIWHDLPCRPCAYDVCPLGHGCANAILPETVLATARRQLDETHRHAA